MESFVQFPCFLPELQFLNCPKSAFSAISADLSQKPKCVKAIYIYGSGFYYSLSENNIPYWDLSHRSYQQLKYKKNIVKILISNQRAFAAVVYFGQVFGFCRLINKSVLKWFLLIMCLNNMYYGKIYPFQQKPSHIVFNLEEKIDRCRQRFTIKKFAIFTRKHVLKQACNFIKKRLQRSSCKYWEISKKTVLKNICIRLLLNRLQEVIDQGFLSGGSLSKTSRPSNITKMPFGFKPEPSLNLTPMLYFELRFPMFIINGYDRKANACSLWTSCFQYADKQSSILQIDTIMLVLCSQACPKYSK